MTDIEKLQWQVEALMNRVAALEAKVNPPQKYRPMHNPAPMHNNSFGMVIDNYPKDSFVRPSAY